MTSILYNCKDYKQKIKKFSKIFKNPLSYHKNNAKMLKFAGKCRMVNNKSVAVRGD